MWLNIIDRAAMSLNLNSEKLPYASSTSKRLDSTPSHCCQYIWTKWFGSIFSFLTMRCIDVICKQTTTVLLKVESTKKYMPTQNFNLLNFCWHKDIFHQANLSPLSTQTHNGCTNSKALGNDLGSSCDVPLVPTLKKKPMEKFFSVGDESDKCKIHSIVMLWKQNPQNNTICGWLNAENITVFAWVNVFH